MNRIARFLLLAAVIVPCAAAASPRAITMDDVLRLRIITAVEPVPGTASAVIAIQDYTGGDKFLRDLYLVSPGATAPRPLTSGGKTRAVFAVSPDGKRVVFAGARAGKSGLFVLPLDGGEATLLAELPVDADNVRWIGDRVYFTAAVFPDLGADLAATKKRLEDRAHGPSARVYDDLFFRPWDFWRDGTHNNLFSIDPATGRVEAVATGAFDVPLVPFGGREDYQVAPDGTVVYAAKKVPDKAVSTNDDLFLAARGAAERRITDNPASDRAPAFSPDGRRVAYLSQSIPGFEADRVRLLVRDVSGGEPFEASAGLDDGVVEFVWSRDGKTLFFTIEEKAHRILYRAEARPGARPERLPGRSVVRRLALSGDGRSLLYTRESMTAPPDAYALDVKTLRETRLTDLNGKVMAGLTLPSVEEIWYDGASLPDGTRQKVHAFLVRPNGVPAGTKVPVVLMIHGGPQGSWLNGFHPRWSPLGIAGKGIAVALPNITGSTGYGQAFVNAVSRDWGGRPFEDTMALLDHLGTLDGLDTTRAAAMGGSYGGYMVNWIEGHSDRFKCLISHAGPAELTSKYGSTDELWFPEWEMGGTPWDKPEVYAKWSPHTYASAFKTPMLVIHGANDFRVPLEQALVMFTLLKRQGVESRLIVYPDETHFVAKPSNRKHWNDSVIDWLCRFLKPGT